MVPFSSMECPYSVFFKKSGTSAFRTLWGFVLEVCKNVPPVRSMVLTSLKFSFVIYFSWVEGSSKSYQSKPPHPRRMPNISYSSSSAFVTTSFIAGFKPGTSPPPVSSPILFFIWCLLILNNDLTIECE